VNICGLLVLARAGEQSSSAMREEMDLGDIVLSWSVQEITNDDLYKTKVIDRSFGWRALGFDYNLKGGCQL
jgi:hypothetical protein